MTLATCLLTPDVSRGWQLLINHEVASGPLDRHTSALPAPSWGQSSVSHWFTWAACVRARMCMGGDVCVPVCTYDPPSVCLHCLWRAPGGALMITFALTLKR